MDTRVGRTAAVIAAGILMTAACGDGNQTETQPDSETASAESTSQEPTETTSPPDDGDDTSLTTAEVKTTGVESTTTETTDPSSTSTTTDSSTTSSSGSTGGEPADGAGPIDEGLRPFIDDAVAQLVKMEAASAADITVESARLTQWRNAAVGCPEPGMQYAQVLTEGSAIELTLDGSTYWFHTGGNRGPFLCESPLREPVE